MCRPAGSQVLLLPYRLAPDGVDPRRKRPETLLY